MSEMHLIEITKDHRLRQFTNQVPRLLLKIHINRQRRDEMTEKKSKSFMVLLTEQ